MTLCLHVVRFWDIQRQKIAWPWKWDRVVQGHWKWRRSDIVFNEILIGLTHALLNIVISNDLSDLEWLSKIFNDTKCRAVSLRQLSFLFIMINFAQSSLFLGYTSYVVHIFKQNQIINVIFLWQATLNFSLKHFSCHVERENLATLLDVRISQGSVAAYCR